MKLIRSILSNVGTLIVLVAIGVGAVWFFSGRAVEDQPTVQQLTATPAEREPTPTQEQKPTPTIEQKPTSDRQPTATPTLHPLTPPDDDSPEPTLTPVIIFSDETPPPLPTPWPTPTSTPVNPQESVVISFEVPASLGEISPDGKTLAFNLVEVKTEGNPYSQIWLMDLPSRQMTKLVERGAVGPNPVWSPDGQKVAYQIHTGQELEVRVIDVAGQNDRSISKSEDLFGFYWDQPGQIGLIRADGIEKVDLAGQIKEKQSINVRHAPSGNKPRVAGNPQQSVTVDDGALRIIFPNGTESIIQAEEGERILEFSLSPNNREIAYVVTQGNGTSLWVSNISGDNRRSLLEQVDENRGSISNPVWSPNSQAIVVFLGEFGTSPNLRLVWVDVKNGQVTPLQTDNLVRNILFSRDGRFLYYTRITDSVDDPPHGKGTFYQLRLQ